MAAPRRRLQRHAVGDMEPASHAGAVDKRCCNGTDVSAARVGLVERRTWGGALGEVLGHLWKT
jgi:hypothetical protein